jgi:hypothetical protein
MKILLMILMLFSISENATYGQELSLEASRLVAQAKKPAEKSKVKPSSFNIGISTRVDAAITQDFLSGDSSTEDIFSLTVIELYTPMSRKAPKTRALVQFRFSTPLPLYDYITYDSGYSLYTMRLGFGVGISQTLADTRSSTGRGYLSMINFVFAADYDMFNFFDTYSSGVYRVELALKQSYFVAKNFAFVFGLEIGGGFSVEYMGRDSYFPYHDDYDVRGFFTYGVSLGLMF